MSDEKKDETKTTTVTPDVHEKEVLKADVVTPKAA
jgi:hypothetical protein